MLQLDLNRFYASLTDLPFSDRWAVMPLQASLPIAPEEISENWSQLQNSLLPPSKRLIYIHIPFCDIHCAFCGFYQNPLRKHDTQQYVRYLLKEIALEASKPAIQSGPIHAIYFGGGTPTALEPDDLGAIITYLRQHLPLAPDCEITVEGRISDFDDKHIDSYITAGANRFSIGIQTFNTAIRQKLGRQSTQQQIIDTFYRIARRDSAALVCDLMFGLPGQTDENWLTDLTIAADLPLDGIDLYALNLLPTTALFKSVENQRIILPSVSDKRQFYRSGADFLEQQGWAQLSNSHWARTTRERNLYNLLIKQGAHYFAFGSCGGGRLATHSFMLARDLTHYYAQLDHNQKPIMMMTGKSLVGDWLYKLQAGIEKGRVDLCQLTDQARLFSPLIEQWYQAGLLKNSELCLRLTTDGRFWASNLLQALQQLLLELHHPEHAKLQQKMAAMRQAKGHMMGPPPHVKSPKPAEMIIKNTQ